MSRYIYRRLALLLPSLLGLSLVSFFLIHLAPGGPLEQRLQNLQSLQPQNYEATKQLEERLKIQYGFNEPLLIRYQNWLMQILRLDFGESFSYQEDVMVVIKTKAKESVKYAVAALVLTYLCAVPLGVIQALREDSVFDWLSGFVLILTFSTPPMVTGLALQALFGAGVQPSSWIYDSLVVLCYTLSYLALLTFLMKNSLLEEIRLEYVQVARAKGASDRRALVVHAFRNALIPLLAGFSYFVGIFFAGSLVVERIFNIDGLGHLAYNSAMSRDYTVLMALILIQALLIMLARFVSDLLYVVVDPRVKL